MTTRKIFTSSVALVGLSLATLVSAQTGGPLVRPAAKPAQNPADKPATETAAMGPFEVAPHWSRYDYPKSIKEGQAYYIVVKGDTLWDISGRFLGNPYLWPQIWEANGYIKKARLIYPGDPIFLPTVQMASAAASTAETEETTTKTKTEEVMGIPEWMDMDALINVASADTVRYAGYISASVEDESLKVKSMEFENHTPLEADIAGTLQYLYLDRGASSGLKAGDLYTVHRRAREVHHPVTGRKVGYRIETTGVARIVLVAERSARAVVTSAGRDVQVGDYLRPFTEVESPLVKRRVVVEGGDLSMDGSRATGYVVDIDDDGIAAATGISVGVDMGAGAGLAVGKVITLFRQADKKDPITKRPLGAAVVVAVRENFSVARMVYTREEVNVGDRVIIQP